MTQVLFDRLKSNLAQCINDGTIYFVTDSNGNFTQIALGDGSKSHVVGIGPKMDDTTKQELMSKLGLTISSDMGTIQLGKLANHNGVSSQKVVTYERAGLGTDVHEISTVGYVQQYMKTAQAMVYAGLFNAQTKEITDYNNAIISPSGEGNVTFDYLLNGNEGETLLTPGMSFIVGTAGNLEGYTGVSVFGGETKVEVGDMIIIINVQQKESEEGGSTYNEASIIVIHNTKLENLFDSKLVNLALDPLGGYHDTNEGYVSGLNEVAHFTLKAGNKYKLHVKLLQSTTGLRINNVYIGTSTTVIFDADINAESGQMEMTSEEYVCTEDVDVVYKSENNVPFEWDIIVNDGVGKVGDNAVTTTKVADNAVTIAKIADFSYDLLLSGLISGSVDDYNQYIQELYINPKFLELGNIVAIRKYSTRNFIVRAFTSSIHSLWSMNIVIPNDYKNYDVLPIKVTTAGGLAHLDDIVGYVVFKDINGFLECQSDTGDGQKVVLDLCTKLFTQKIIYDYVKGIPNLSVIADGAVTAAKIANNSVTTEKIKDENITPSKLSFLESKNLIDTQDIDYVIGKRLEPSGRLSDGDYITTGFIKVESGQPYVLSALSDIRYIAIYTIYYDINKKVLDYNNVQKETGFTITFPDGAAYYRITFDGSATNLQFEKGITPTEYSSFKKIISKDLLPQTILEDDVVTTSNLADNAVTLQKVGNGVSSFKGIYIALPSKIYAVVGDKIQIFFRSIVNCANVYEFDVIAICSKGKSYPRYWEYTPIESDAGNTTTITIKVRDNALNTIVEKSSTIVFVSQMLSPTTNKNILCIGASATANGVWVGELKRRLTENSGSGTPANPVGLNLSNITFVGRKQAGGVNLEATGGWKVQTYASKGEKAIRLQVTGVTQLHIGDTYTATQGGGVWVLQEINVTEGVGNLRFTFNSSLPTIPSSGTLTKTSGAGDQIITYLSYEQETYSPFWNDNLNRLDFITYANNWCNGSIDVMIWHCGVNDIFSGQEIHVVNAINAFKAILRQYHTDFPNGKVIISSVPIGCVKGGMSASYGASETSNICTFANISRKYSLALNDLCNDVEFSEFVTYSAVLEEFDAENSYQTSDTPVNNRVATTEKLGTNGVHPTQQGSYQVADSIYRSFNVII